MDNKKQKKLTRRLLRIDENQTIEKQRQDVIITTLVIWLFVVFCVVLSADQIVLKFFWRDIKTTQGVGWGQVLVALGILGNMWWLKKMMR